MNHLLQDAKELVVEGGVEEEVEGHVTDEEHVGHAAEHLVEGRVEELPQGVAAGKHVGHHHDVTESCRQDADHGQADDGDEGQGQACLQQQQQQQQHKRQYELEEAACCDG